VLQLDIDTASTRLVVDGQKRITRWKTDGAGRVRLGVAIDGTTIRTWYRDADADDFGLIDERDISEAGGFSALAVGDRPGLLYVATSQMTGRRAVYAWDTGQRRFTGMVASRPDADIDSLMVDRGKVIGYGYVSDEPALVFLDPVMKADAERIAQALPQYRTAMVDSTVDGGHALILAAGGNRPGLYYLLTRSGGKATLAPLGAIHPDIPDDALAPVNPATYRARDGLVIHAYVTLPRGVANGPIPFIVMPHGGPSARDSVGFDYIAQMLASRGYGVLQPNFRGSTGYGAAFERAGFQQWGLAMQDDVTDGARWLIDRKLADPARICIVGWSYGGYSALMGAVKTPGLFRCAISMAGVSDLRRRLDRASRSRWPDLNLPRYDSDPVSVEANSPVLHADRIRIPVLLVHGRRDFTVPVEDTEAMEEALKRAGKEVETLYFDDDDHYLFREPDRIAFLEAMDRFLARNLGPGARPGVDRTATN
jgi:dipeptidyl aminopeptidase/acylaminoacyl peptidase